MNPVMSLPPCFSMTATAIPAASSCTAATTLSEAAAAAYERLCRELQLQTDDAVLEIGSAWGGFAIHAASRYGCRIVAAVESDNQIQPARQRVQAAGVTDRVKIVPKDFRQAKGRYDKLVSIETIESMGRQYRDIFFQFCSRLLKDNGMMALQAVTKSGHAGDRRPYDTEPAGPFIH